MALRGPEEATPNWTEESRKVAGRDPVGFSLKDQAGGSQAKQ